MPADSSTTTATPSSGKRPAFILQQLFDMDSHTFTYLLADPITREAVLIDPVREHVERDAKLLQELGLKLVYALNTHVHADHVTGTGLLKKIFPESKSVLGLTGNEAAIADVKLPDNATITVGGIELRALSTPGHTRGCYSYYWPNGNQPCIFTGDALLIRGCGRTDFQGGSSETLYQSIHNKVFTLPDDVLVYPAHDYKGFSVSTIHEEKTLNPRLTLSLSGFVDLMHGLNLPYPRKIDESLPLNLVCGLQQLDKVPDATASAI